MEKPEGIFLIDKPIGITSFDVIRELRRKPELLGVVEGTKMKLGHAGTLDPLASGLMIIALNKATKLLQNYLKLSKTYIAEVCIGERTTTGDREGDVLESSTVTNLEECVVREALETLVGVNKIAVPQFSAIKQGGEALYKKARRGEDVVTPIKEMVVHEATLTNLSEKDNLAYAEITFAVGSGTYIRSLAEELGKKLGYPARLENLRRTQVGKFNIEDAIPLR